MENINKRTARKIRELKSSLPAIILEKHLIHNPSLNETYTEKQRELYLEDTGFHFSYLAESISAGSLPLFTEYILWIKSFFANLPVPETDLINNFELMKSVLCENLTDEMKPLVSDYMDKGIEHFKQAAPVIKSFISDDNPQKELAEKYLDLLIMGNRKDAGKIIMDAFNQGVSIKELYLNVFSVTQKETGRLWQMNKLTVAQEHYITAATQLIMSQLYPYLFGVSNKDKSIVVSCAPGELHEIGARMVADFFELEGWNSYYYGANTPQASLLDAMREHKPDVLALSATMTYNISAIEQLIERVRAESAFDNIRILVGGYPFLVAGDLWKEIGADGCAENPADAIKLAETLISGKA